MLLRVHHQTAMSSHYYVALRTCSINSERFQCDPLSWLSSDGLGLYAAAQAAWLSCQQSSHTHLYQHLFILHTGTGAVFVIGCAHTVFFMCTFKHCRQIWAKYQLFTHLSLCVSNCTHTHTHTCSLFRGIQRLLTSTVHPSLCLCELFVIPVAMLQWWRVSNFIISIITAIIPCLPLMQANGWPIKIDEPGSVELIDRTWCLASVLIQTYSWSASSHR